MDVSATAATAVRDGWVLWEVPGKPVIVHLSVDVVSRLGLAAREGFKALPRRGLETGGLLIGTRRDSGSQVVVEIEDFEAVESEHAAGPSYLLSETDRRLLESRIAAHGTSGRKPHVVGFYRSHTRNGIAITPEDECVFSNYFRKSSDVFLLIKSNEPASPTGGFLIREGGKVLSETPYLQFTFNAEFAPRAARAPMSLPAPAFVPALPAQAVVPATSPAFRFRAFRPVIFAAASAAILATGISFAIWRRPPVRASAGSAAPLALSISNSGNGLRLTWNRPVGQQAGQAILHIRDGEVEQKVDLDAKQLREGSIAYWPRTRDVDFRLQLIGRSGTVTESVRSIGGPVPPPERTAPIEDVAPAPSLPPVRTAPAVRPVTPTRKPSVRGFRAFEFTESPVRRASVPEPPPIDQTAVPDLSKSRSFLMATAPIARPGSSDRVDLNLRVRVDPVQHTSRSFPFLGKRHQETNYKPPVPVREPSIPPLPSQDLGHPVNIDVKVSVNQSGKVEYSELLSKVTPDNRDLAAAAVFSARKWEFVPAHAGSEAVRGQVILHYQFGSRHAAADQKAER